MTAKQTVASYAPEVRERAVRTMHSCQVLVAGAHRPQRCLVARALPIPCLAFSEAGS